jgi:hydrogenase expression/formation protein HypD
MLRKDFKRFNIENNIPVRINFQEDNELCICGEILRGLKTPDNCSLFADICFPENPLGACMVSNEGACNTWYKYRLTK